MGFVRVANIGLRVLPDAIGLAFVFAFIQIVLLYVASFFINEAALMWSIAAFAALAHGIFIVLIADRTAENPRPRDGPHNLMAGVLLAVPLFAFAWADFAGANYFCADGAIVERGHAPLWPWFWIGWVVMTLSAAPMRLLGWVNGVRFTFKPLWLRALYTIPSALVIGVLGALFQLRRLDCAAPQVSFGIMDGGIIAIPLYMLFFFTMSFTMAVLSAGFICRTHAES